MQNFSLTQQFNKRQLVATNSVSGFFGISFTWFSKRSVSRVSNINFVSLLPTQTPPFLNNIKILNNIEIRTIFKHSPYTAIEKCFKFCCIQYRIYLIQLIWPCINGFKGWNKRYHHIAPKLLKSVVPYILQFLHEPKYIFPLWEG